MRSTRFTLVLVGTIGCVLLLLLAGLIYLLTADGPSDGHAPATARATDPSTTPTTRNAEQESTASAAPRSTSMAPTGRAWQTSPPPGKVPSPATPSLSPSSHPEGLNRQGMGANELVTTAALVMTTWDTATDKSPTDGYRRALPLFVREYGDIFVVPAKPVLPPDWWGAAEHDATSTPRVQITDTYPQGEATLYYVVAHWTWESDDGWKLDAGPKYMTFQVARDDTGFVIENWTEDQLQ